MGARDMHPPLPPPGAVVGTVGTAADEDEKKELEKTRRAAAGDRSGVSKDRKGQTMMKDQLENLRAELVIRNQVRRRPAHLGWRGACPLRGAYPRFDIPDPPFSSPRDFPIESLCRSFL